jgi:hypothetical protein
MVAGALMARVATGYGITALGKKRRTPEEHDARLSAQHRRSAERIYSGVLGLLFGLAASTGAAVELSPSVLRDSALRHATGQGSLAQD